MSKSFRSFVADIYCALMRDIVSAFPHLESEVSRDTETLWRCFGNRGVTVWYSDLPKAGKVLDKVLDTGSLEHLSIVDRSIPFMGVKGQGDLRPRFLHGLWSLICDANGRLLEEIDYVALIFLRQVYYLAKKVKVPCPQNTVEASYLDFIAKDRELPTPTKAWLEGLGFVRGKDGLKLDVLTPKLKYLVGSEYIPPTDFNALLMRNEVGRQLLVSDPTLGQRLTNVFALISTSLGRFDPLQWRCKHGPGAIAARTGKSWKYVWYSWPSHLEKVFPVCDFGFHNLSSWVRNHTRLPKDTLEEASRLIAVRKTFDKPRLIAAEPNSHQWCQQNMLDYITTGIRQSWIYDLVTLRRQGRNQEMCRMASMTRELATLDLSDASDSVSCDLVEVAFKSNPTLLKGLIAVRTRYVRVPLAQGEVVHMLNKFSTMGSAVTFPVQTLIFLGICLAVCHRQPFNPEAMRHWSGQISVYGDDIIVPCTQWERVTQALEALGFKVNVHKSFAKGFFRESCGLDSYRGVDITPTYLSHPEVAGPESAIGLSETANHFYKKWMLNVSETIKQTVEAEFKLPAVATDSGVVGFCSRVPPSHAPKMRWNRDLQRVEVRVLGVIQPKEERITPNDDQCILQFLTEQPDPHDEWKAGYDTDAQVKLRLRWVPASSLYGNWLGG